jgi:HEAT repeat protein
LIASLDDADPNVRRTVPLSLSFFDNEGKCVPAVMDRLQKGEKDLRWAYIDCLGRMESKAKMAIPLLKQLSRDPDDDVRRHACMALERIEGR